MPERPDPRHQTPPTAPVVPRAGEADTPAPQLPNSETAARMAANMLQSALAQKTAIADSFKAQRSAILDAVAAQKNANVAGLSPPSAAAGAMSAAANSIQRQGPTSTVRHPAPEADSDAKPRSSTVPGADVVGPVATPPAPPAASENPAAGPELGDLGALFAGGASGIDQVVIAGAIVETLRVLIAREVSHQLSAPRRDQG